MSFPEAVWPALTGLGVAFAASVLIVATKRWHGALSADTHPGPHKLHDAPTPRIGGIALFAGLLAAAAASPPAVSGLLLTLGIGGLAAFVVGLAEDATNRVPPALRLAATFLSAWSICILGGYTVTRADLPFIDGFLGLPLVSIALTTVLLAGLTHAVNIIDGCHGLAAGTAIIMLCALGVLSHAAGDAELVWTAATLAAVLSGFLLVNFPFGRVFLGDGGAYLTGLATGAVAVMLAARNPEVSVWVVAVVLAYPALETLVSIVRKSVRKGGSPFRPDELHLHLMLHRRLAVRRGREPERERAANPLTGALMWGGALTGLVFVAVFPHDAARWATLFLALQLALYLAAYGLLLPSPPGRAAGASVRSPVTPREVPYRSEPSRVSEAGASGLGSPRSGHAD